MADSPMTRARGSGLVLDETTVRGFGTRVRGPLLRPGDAGYDEARTVFNAMNDRHPALIVPCTGVADVIAAVEFARTQDLLVPVRGGDHSVAGHSVYEGGLMIDLSRMRSVRVDYVNGLGEEDSQHKIRAAYRPQTSERLVALKNMYDPTNLFRLDPNIQPTV